MPLIPVAVAASKAIRNATDDEPHQAQPLMAQATRKASVVERLCAGSNMSHWSEQHLDRMIKTNSVFQEHQDQLRRCWTDANNYGDVAAVAKVSRKKSWTGEAQHGR